MIKTRKLKSIVVPEMSEDKEFKQELQQILIDCGISPSLMGFNYIRDGVMILKANYDVGTPLPEVSIISVYEAISLYYKDRSIQKVERCIRNAVTQAFLKGNIKLLEEIFSYTISSVSGKVKNREFLIGLCLYLIEKERKLNG